MLWCEFCIARVSPRIFQACARPPRALVPEQRDLGLVLGGGNDGAGAGSMTSGGADADPDGAFEADKKNKKVVDINHFHVFLAYAHSGVLKATAQQHGIQLVGKLASCAGCLMVKGIHAPTPRHTTARAAAPMDMVNIDTPVPYLERLGGSRHVVMFMDSASHLQRWYGTQDKSASTILGVVRRFVTGTGVPRAVRADNGPEGTNSTLVDCCNGLEIHRELTAPYPGHSPSHVTDQPKGSSIKSRY